MKWLGRHSGESRNPVETIRYGCRLVGRHDDEELAQSFIKCRSERIARYFCLLIVALPIACSDPVTEQAMHHNRPVEGYMVAVNRPDHMHLIELATNSIVRTCKLPAYATPGTVVMSPDHNTAYVLANRFREVYGLNIDSCELVFSTRQNHDNLRVISYGTIAVSPDGRELYLHQNPTLVMNDHYEVQETRLAVFSTAAGLDAEPIRSLPAPRQIMIINTDASGTLYLAGPDVYAMYVQTGDLRVVIPSRSLDDPRYSPRDALTIWPIGTVSNEFIRLYTVARFTDDSRNPETADWLWGYERIDLSSGAAESREFAPLEAVFFSGMHRPGHADQIYMTFNKLKRFDVTTMQESGSVDLDHSYYQVNFSPDGSTVYVSGAEHDIGVFDAETLQKITNIQLPGGDMALSTTAVFKR